MGDFLVRRDNSKHGNWYMYIGFNDIRADCDLTIKCFGSAMIRPDDHSEYWFDYSFHHSPDWREFSEVILRPNKKHTLTKEQIKKISNDIIRNIKQFICMMN